MARERYCRVCLAPKGKDELDTSGRCRICRSAKAATDAGLTYGKYIAAQRETSAASVWPNSTLPVCKYCGGPIPSAARNREFCCFTCRKSWDDATRKKTAQGREPPPAAAGKPVVARLCVWCGKEMEFGQRLYCCIKCRDAAHAARDAAKRRERENRKHPCVICGKPIAGDDRKKYCCQSCAKEGRQRKKREAYRREATE